MSKELDYEINNFANLLHKDCMNLMECLKKQSEDNKPILYLGKHYEKVILPYKEYQKMCKRLEEQEKKTYSDELKLVEKKLHLLESIDNAKPSEALECLEKLFNEYKELCVDTGSNEHIYQECNLTSPYNTIKQALLKAQEPKKYLKWEDLEFKEENQWIKVKMGDNLYRMDWFIDGLGANVVSLYKYITNDYLVYCVCIKDNSHNFFNDLHLERVEE